MSNLNRYFVLFCLSTSLNVFSQTADGGLKNTSADQSVLSSVLLSFDAILVDKKVELTWASNTEHNNNFFTIEKSKDASNFETVTTIKSFGNYSSLISYFDTDYTPYEGISYYRLKQTDQNGKILSSRLVSVNNKFGSASFAGNTIIDDHSTLMGYENTEVLVVLRDEKGTESYSKVIIDSQNNVIVPADKDQKLENGTYTVVASSNNKLYSQKVYVK
ncbi:MAG: hypothetical protein K0S53_2479 [Bacteroidetes bacterium]|jgi:hypothetical protein|nr:hypothetical protein [Bacteroidota bacterium]MDF2451387.1 hypothetical protein [Bacteroidota bacterium]